MVENGDRFTAALRAIVAKSSQVEVAQRSGVTQATISRMVSGQRIGRISTVYKLLEAYPELSACFLPQNTPK